MMKIFECKCGSKEIFIEQSGNNTGLYCADCGKWIKWLNKDEIRLANRQIENQNAKVRADVIDKFKNLLNVTHFIEGYGDMIYALDLEIEIGLMEQKQ